MIVLQQVDAVEDIAGLKKAYLRSLVAPQDCYWETAVIGLAPHIILTVNGQAVGYCAINKADCLLEFYVNSPALAAELFATVLTERGVKTAVAGTNDPFYLSLCLDRQQKVAVNTYLFHVLEPLPTNPSPGTIFRLGMQTDLAALVDFYGRNNEYEDTESIEAGFGGRQQYAQDLINKGQVFLLTEGPAIIGIGECRFSVSQPVYADIGMIVEREQRRCGWGTQLLRQLGSYCKQHGRQPICSCAADNIASRKAIEKAGFVAQHRLLDIWF
ncbi:MAG: GNAT family N-acetyltransferase [Chloroflexi bacterium]|nr:GNAT family N-acetyltransferase [Chloroflexota bacterium]